MSEAPNPPTGRQVNQITKSTNKLKKKIRKQQAFIQNLKTLPYYTVFNQRAQQEKDIAKAERKLMRLFVDLLIRSYRERLSEASNKQITASTNQH